MSKNSAGSRAAEVRRRGGGARLIAALMAVLFIIACLILAVLHLALEPAPGGGRTFLAAGARAAVGVLFFLSAAGASLTLASCIARRDLTAFIPSRARRAALLAAFPVCRLMGRVAGISPDDLSRSLIAACNRLVAVTGGAAGGERGGLLVLLPRCLQGSTCARDVVKDILECRRCGSCDLARLGELMDLYGFSMAVVPGGRLAQELVRMKRPAAVIAVACEKELVEGLKSVSSVPVIAITNLRPHGPCRDTELDLAEFEAAVKSLLVSRGP